MNATIELLRTRRSAAPALLTGPGPTSEERELLLTIGARVPDHGKLAPFRFIVFEGAAREKAGAIIAEVFAKSNPGADHARIEAERKRLALAPLVIAVVSRAAPHEKIPQWEQILAAGAVCMSLVIAAHAMGFATAWITEWYAYERAVLDRFGLSETERIAGFIHIGRHPGPREDRPRPALTALVTNFGE
ncbi:MAG TPA: nitroreductase [Methylovirgula sp.]|nr:nitroreductase [Methylovirgula sp.]